MGWGWVRKVPEEKKGLKGKTVSLFLYYRWAVGCASLLEMGR